MSVQLAKWGNTLGIRIPSFIVTKADLRPGDLVEIEMLESGEIILKPVPKPKPNLEDLVAGITPENRHPETDWGEAAGNEVW